MPAKSDHFWQRLWLRLDTTSPQARIANELADAEATAVSLSSLRDVPCLILLGSPGLGKSNEIQLAAYEAISRGETADVISLGRLSGIEELESRILTKVQNLSLKDRTWNIFLDGLDEALPQFTKNNNAISTVFQSLAQVRDLSTVRLRISCRSAEWPKALETDLNDFWGAKFVRIYELQELSDEDVIIATSQFSPEQSERFLDQIKKNEVEALTQRPVTLNMLLDVFERDSQLPSRRVQLYREALLASVGDRGALGTNLRLDAKAKLMIAARIAAASIFSNSSEIWTGIENEKPRERAITLSDIAGGFEPASDGSVQVGEAELNQALLTSLFSLVGDSLFIWSHQTFAEFLAAYYLIEHRLSPPKILELLRSSAGSRVAPQLREVCAWLASMDQSFFGALVNEEPDILLRSDVASASSQDREALVRELLLRYERSELHDFDFNSRSRYDELAHPSLGEQLRPYIGGRQKNIVVRRVAIDIAEANEGAGLDNLLADISLDPTEDYHIRTQAAAAISKIPNKTARLRLRPLLGDNVLDENDELKGYALRALWPEHLSINELLASLTPEKNTNWLGSYSFFLSSFEVSNLRDEDVSAVLDWILSVAGTEDHSRTFDRAIPRFLDRVWDRSNSPNVIESLASFILKLVSSAQYFSFQELAPDFFNRISRSVTRRMSLVNEIVRNTIGNNWSWLAAMYPAHMVSYDDLPWLLDRVVSPTGDFPEDAAVQLIIAVVGRRDINDLEDVWDAGTRSPALMKALQSYFSSELSSSHSRFQRDDFKRSVARKANEDKDRFDAVRAINTRLQKIESDDAFGWWELNLAFLANKRGQVIEEFNSDLTATKVWSVLDPTVQDRVFATSIRFLTLTRLETTSWLGTNTFHRPAAAAYRAFRLLLTLDKERFFQLPATVWKTWASSIFVSFNNDDEEARKIIVLRAYEMAPDTVCRGVARIMLKEKSEITARRITQLLDPCFDDRLGELFWKFLNRLKNDGVASAIVFYLASKEFPKVSQLLLRRMEDNDREPTAILTKEQFVSGLSGLLAANAERVWPKFVAFRGRQEELALEVIKAVAQNARFDGSLIEKLGESDLADFFIWTYKRIPPNLNDRGHGFRSVGPDEQIDHLRNAALKRLVALGTTPALAGVQRIAADLPEAPWLKYQVLDARRAVDAKTWKLREPSELIATIALFSPNASPRSTKAAITSAAAETLDDGALLGSSLVNETAFQDTVELPAELLPITPRKILAVATEWRSGHGGISTFNRELCIALAELGHQVACLVMNMTQQEASDAKLANVQLIAPPKDPGTSIEDSSNLLLFSKGQLTPFEPEVVIGHDHITGLAGHHIARRVYGVPYVHFVHTLPEEIEKYKTRNPGSLLRGGVKSGIQTQQCKLAQLVVAVGPRIYADFCSRLGWAGTAIIEIQPGLSRKLLKHTVDLAKPRRSDCLLVARLEDPILKGAPLACHVITQLNSAQSWQPSSRRPKLILRGFTIDAFESELGAIDGMEAAREFVNCRPYTPEEDDIAGDICGASVLIMPSKQEGFGLTALEAIAAGIPIVITSESGLGEFLLNKKISTIDSIAEKCVVDVIGEIDEVTNNWASRIADIFNNPKAAFDDAAKLRSALLSVLTWERAARSLSNEIEPLLKHF